MMKDAKLIPIKLLLSLIIPLLAVTIGGFIVYQSPTAFFFAAQGQTASESNGPAVIYYALTLVIALMFFLLRQGYKGYEFVALGLLTLVYSLSLKGMTPGVFRPIHVYMLPLLAFFLMMWVILKYIFLNKSIRTFRLILFSILSAAAFALAFWIQYLLLNQPVSSVFLQSRFVSGLMLFIFMGFGLSMAEFAIIRLETKLADNLKVYNEIELPDSNITDEDKD